MCSPTSLRSWVGMKVCLLDFLGVFINLILDVDESSRFVEALLSYSNIEIKILTVAELVRGTIAEKIFRNGRFSRTRFYMANLSDVFRLIILSKHGGIYLDLDVIVTKRLDLLPSNFVCRESKYFVNGAVMSMDKKSKINFPEIFLK